MADEQRTVLVVDDHPDLCQMVRFAFEREGFRVYEAQDGDVALDVLRHVRPSAIILDIGMPRMDGWAFRAAQRELPGLRDVPVVVFTGIGATDPPSPDLAPAAVVRKGAGVAQLLATVKRLLG